MLLSAATNGSWDRAAVAWPIAACALLGAGWVLSRDLRGLPVVRAGLTVAAVGAAVHALLQHLGIDPFPRTDPFPDRVVGPFANPNHLGGFAAAALPMLISAYLSSWSASPSPDRRAGVRHGAAAVVVYCALLLAGSRGAMWGAVFGCALAVVGYGRAARAGRRPWRWGGPLGLAAALAIATALLWGQPVMRRPVAPVAVRDRIEGMTHVAGRQAVRDPTVLHRLVLWSAARRVIVADPWLGAGPGAFPTAYSAALQAMAADPHVAAMDAGQRRDATRHAHNEILHLWAECGLVALAPFLCVIGLGLRGGARNFLITHDLQGAGALGMAVAILVLAMVSYPLHQPATAVPFWLVLGIMSRSAKDIEPTSRYLVVKTI